MTHISFLHGAADRLQATVHWLHQAWAERQPVLVYVPDEATAQQLDRALWTQPALSFTPHCAIDSPLAAETPIILTPQLETPPQVQCLLNLSNALPASFSRFEQMIEIVSTDDRDRLPARERFKIYRDHGCVIDSRDISGGV